MLCIFQHYSKVVTGASTTSAKSLRYNSISKPSPVPCLSILVTNNSPAPRPTASLSILKSIFTLWPSCFSLLHISNITNARNRFRPTTPLFQDGIISHILCTAAQQQFRYIDTIVCSRCNKLRSHLHNRNERNRVYWLVQDIAESTIWWCTVLFVPPMWGTLRPRARGISFTFPEWPKPGVGPYSRLFK